MGKHPGSSHPRRQRLFVHLLHLLARHTFISPLCNAELVCNGKRRVRPVPGNHDRPDSGTCKLFHRLRRLGAYRVFHSCHPQKRKPALLHLCRFRMHANRQHAKSRFRHLGKSPFCLFSRRRRKRRRLAVAPHIPAPLQDFIRRSLRERDSAVQRLMQRRHPFPLRIEGNLVDPRHGILQCLALYAERCRHIQER